MALNRPMCSQLLNNLDSDKQAMFEVRQSSPKGNANSKGGLALRALSNRSNVTNTICATAFVHAWFICWN